MKMPLMVGLVLILAWPGGDARAQRAGPPGQRRAELQEQVFRRFVDVASHRLQLEDEQREALGSLLREGQENRRQLHREMADARFELARLTREGREAAAVAGELERLEQLRRREFELWQSEQDALRALLTPVQHAEFLVLQMRLSERVRELQRAREPGQLGPRARRPRGPPPGR